VSWTEYNANTWTSDEVVSDVRRRARLSDTDIDYTAAVILREATDQIWSIAARVEAQARDGRKTFDSSRTVTTDSVVASGADYVLPPMCSADAVSSIFWVNSTGDTVKLAAVSVDREPDFLGETGDPTTYALLDREVRLYPTPLGISGTLRIMYQRRHPALVASTSVRAVTAIATASSGAATKFTLSSAPPAEVAVGSWVDVVGSRIPHSVHYADAIVTAVSGADVTVSVAYATMAAAADSTAARNYLQSSGQSYFVQLPLEMRGAVAGLTSASILGQMGDLGSAQRSEQAAMRELADIGNFLATRTKGTKEKIINRFSLMRSHVRNNW
jgi:hypothetical protein